MPDPIDTMTLDACRDRIAELKGWTIYRMPAGVPLYLAPGKQPDDECQADHPVPPTLDAIAGAMPKGWRWRAIQFASHENRVTATAQNPNHPNWSWSERANANATADTEILARARCVIKVLEASVPNA